MDLLTVTLSQLDNPHPIFPFVSWWLFYQDSLIAIMLNNVASRWQFLPHRTGCTGTMKWKWEKGPAALVTIAGWEYVGEGPEMVCPPIGWGGSWGWLVGEGLLHHAAGQFQFMPGYKCAYVGCWCRLYQTKIFCLGAPWKAIKKWESVWVLGKSSCGHFALVLIQSNCGGKALRGLASALLFLSIILEHRKVGLGRQKVFVYLLLSAFQKASHTKAGEEQWGKNAVQWMHLGLINICQGWRLGCSWKKSAQ